MSRKSRMADLREAKDKRAKKLAVGGVLLLAAVLAFEVPKVLKHGASSSAPPAATTTAAADAGVSATPATTAPGTAAASVMPAASTKLTNSDVAPRRSKSQLYSFSHFAGKDPFVQQVSASDTASPSGSSGASGGASAGNNNSGVITSSATPAQKTTARTLARTGAVTIQVNGKAQSVRIGGSFPSSNPLFKLVAITHGVARIAIANGSYASGAQTVSLAAGRSLTLVDTADSIRYKLTLVSA